MPLATPITLAREISPPPARRSRTEKTQAIEKNVTFKKPDTTMEEPGLAAVEAGEAQVDDHLAYFSHHLYRASRQTPADFPRIELEDFQDLYARNQHAQGRHFVVHQHDHPIAGRLNDSPYQYSSRPKLMMQGKVCIMTCDCSSPKRAPSASPYRMACLVIQTRSDPTAWPLRLAYTICGTIS